MLRYLAAIFHPRDPDHRQIVEQITHAIADWPHWQCVEQSQDLRIWCADLRPGSLDAHILPDHTGVIFGTVFRRSNARRASLAVFSPETCRHIAASAGRSLITHHWGRYVAILRDPRSGTVRILRDPTAAVPCFYTQQRGVWLCMSDPQDATDVGALPIEFNRDYLIAQAITPGLICEETTLNGVRELLGGQCITVQNEKLSKCFYWHPAEYAQRPPLEDPTTAAEELERLTRYGVESFAALHPRLVLLASGGVDSSIVAACLQRTSSQVVGFTSYGDNPAGDERRYSRLLRDHTGFEWIEEPANTGSLSGIRPPRTVRSRSLHTVPQELQFTAAAEDRGATAIVTGNGGDGILYECREHAAEDYRRTHGVRGLYKITRQSAKLKRISIPYELRQALGRSEREPYNPLAEGLKRAKLTNAIAAISVAQQPERFTHGWLQHGTESVTAGQRRHISMMMMFPFIRPITWKNGDPERIAPLLNQDLMEFLLPLRAYTLLHGGRTRGLARLAFTSHLPPAIINRTDKGDTRGDMWKLRQSNLPGIRSTLPNGYLVQNNILDGAAVNEGVSDTPSDVTASELLRAHWMELGLQEWLRSDAVARSRNEAQPATAVVR